MRAALSIALLLAMAGCGSRARAPRAAPAPAPRPPTASPLVGPSDPCLAELAARGVPFRLAEPAPGVALPVRLAGPLRGLDVHGPEPAHERWGSRLEILDCRLALALDDLAAVLAAQGIVEVVHMSLWREGAHIGGGGKASQHASGLAIDVGTLVRRDGARLVVARDWHPRMGAPPCGPGAEASEASHEGAALRAIVCDLASRRLFSTLLTPNFNREHHDHVHLDLTAGRTVTWVR